MDIDYQRLINCIEKMQLLGFPQVENIGEFENLSSELQKLLADGSAYKISKQLINEMIHRIKERLSIQKKIPVYMYMKLNRYLIVFRENLLFDMHNTKKKSRFQ